MLATIAALILASPVTPAPPVRSAADDNKKVCRSLNMTGTRLGGKRICKTRAQWDADAKFAQEDSSEITGKPGYGPGSR